MVGGAGPQSRRGECRRRRADVEADRLHACGHTVARGIVARQFRKGAIDLNQGYGKIIDAGGDGEPGRADAGAEIDQALPWPRRTRRRQQHGIVTDSMALARLAQDEPAAQNGVFADVRRLSGDHG
jgi:hypothetical protein